MRQPGAAVVRQRVDLDPRVKDVVKAKLDASDADHREAANGAGPLDLVECHVARVQEAQRKEKKQCGGDQQARLAIVDRAPNKDHDRAETDSRNPKRFSVGKLEMIRRILQDSHCRPDVSGIPGQRRKSQASLITT
jgi:hypothetical protein